MVRVRVLSASRDVVVFRQLTVEHIRNDELSKRKKQQFFVVGKYIEQTLRYLRSSW